MDFDKHPSNAQQKLKSEVWNIHAMTASFGLWKPDEVFFFYFGDL